MFGNKVIPWIAANKSSDQKEEKQQPAISVLRSSARPQADGELKKWNKKKYISVFQKLG